jgi:hypothetical protein
MGLRITRSLGQPWVSELSMREVTRVAVRRSRRREQHQPIEPYNTKWKVRANPVSLCRHYSRRHLPVVQFPHAIIRVTLRLVEYPVCAVLGNSTKPR